MVVSYEEYGMVKTHALKPGGDDIPVTNHNRHEYVQLYINYLLEDSISQQVSPSLPPSLPPPPPPSSLCALAHPRQQDHETETSKINRGKIDL
jgi:hypothetical protein